jgi:hypothetical protein
MLLKTKNALKINALVQFSTVKWVVNALKLFKWVGLERVLTAILTSSTPKIIQNYMEKYLTLSDFSPGSSVSLGACQPCSGLLVCAQKMQILTGMEASLMSSPVTNWTYL